MKKTRVFRSFDRPPLDHLRPSRQPRLPITAKFEESGGRSVASTPPFLCGETRFLFGQTPALFPPILSSSARFTPSEHPQTLPPNRHNRTEAAIGKAGKIHSNARLLGDSVKGEGRGVNTAISRQRRRVNGGVAIAPRLSTQALSRSLEHWQ